MPWLLRPRRAVGRGLRYSRLRGVNEAILDPLWGRFPLHRFAHRLLPPLATHADSFVLADYRGKALRIAFLSDLHAGPTTPCFLIDQAVEATLQWQPDAVLLGGDYVYFRAEYIHRIEPALRRLAAASPTFGVWGNHDLWADDKYLAHAFADFGVRMLCNERINRWLGQPIDLYGLDDPWTGVPDVTQLRPSKRPTILLCHNPDALLLIEPQHRADLIVCGHTHGGQICHRNGRPFFVHALTGTRFAAGRYSHEGRHVFVSRGLGTVEVPVRRFSPPEIALLTIQGESSNPSCG